MAVAFDAVGSATGFSSTTTTLSWTHTAGAGGSTVLVALAWGSTSFPPTVSAITYGGNPMTLLGSQSSGGVSGNGGVLLYGLGGQGTGSKTVSFTFSGAATDEAIGNSMTFTGAAGFGTAVTAQGSGTSASVTVSGTTAGNMVAGGECHGTNGTVTWTSGTKRGDDEVSAGSGASNLSCGTNAAGGSVALTATIPSDVWGFVAVEVKAPGGVVTRPSVFQPSRTWSRKWTKTVRPNIPPQLQQVAVSVPAATVAAVANPPIPPYISAISGTGTAGYFVDQAGKPKFLLLEQAWALPWNAGRWNSGQWQSDMDTYFTKRSAQGYSAWYGTAWSDDHVDSTALSGGRTWDGIYPIVVNGTPGKIATGSETITLNNSFWTRIDYLFNSALSKGIACFLNLGMQYDFTGANNIWFNLSTTQANTFGQLLAARYPLSSFPNVQWFFGDDGSGGQDTFFTQMVSGLATGGDTRTMISCEQLPETNSHIQFNTGAVFVTSGFGMSSSVKYNWTYTYDPTYNGVEKGYTESGTTLLPVVYGDGIWYGDNSTSQNVADYTARRVTWWALASGVRGTNVTCGPTTGGDVWQWQSGAVGDLTSDPNGTWITGHIGSVVSYFSGLTDWQKLIPDTGNVFITAGRGTKTSNDAPGFNAAKYGDTDNYVAGSITPGGTLAVVYSGQHFSITIDQTKLASGYTATWVDPWSLATTSATTGTTYNSTGLGNNSQGNPDWALVFQAPPATNAPAAGVPVNVVAPQPSTAVTVNAGVAAVSVAAPAATVADTANAGAPTVLVAAPAPAGASTATAGVGIVLVADPGATVTTSSNANAPAGVATVSVIAPAATVADTATAGVPVVLVRAAAPVPAETVTAGAGTVQALAPAPVPAAGALPGVAVINAVDPGATGNTGSGTTVSAAVAAVQAVAVAPDADTVIAAGVAVIGTVALDATANTSSSTNAHAGPAAVQAAAVAPSLTLAASPAALAAVVLALGVPPPPPLQQARSTAAVTDPRDGTATVTAMATSNPGVT